MHLLIIYILIGVISLYFWPSKKVNFTNSFLFLIGGLVGYLIGLYLHEMANLPFSIALLLAFFTSFALVELMSSKQERATHRSLLWKMPFVIILGTFVANIAGLLTGALFVEAYYSIRSTEYILGAKGLNLLLLMAVVTTPVSLIISLVITNFLQCFTVIHGVVITGLLVTWSTLFFQGGLDIMIVSIGYCLAAPVTLSLIFLISQKRHNVK